MTALRDLTRGPDDYLTKPFAVKELLARIRSVTRRNGETFTPHLLTFANLEFNTETQEVKGENTIRLSSKEGKLLRYFLLNPEKEHYDGDCIYACMERCRGRNDEYCLGIYIVSKAKA